MLRGQAWMRRVGLLLLIAGLFAGAVVPPHVDDPACTSAPVVHDERAHRITTTAERSDTHADHCILCHTFRSFHPPSERFEDRDGVRDSERLYVCQTGVSSRVAWSLVPERAPPV